jgi:hypothetical protein
MDEQNQTAAPAEITVEQAAKARRAEEQLAAYTKQQEEQQAAADAFLAKASAMLGHQVTSFFMVAVGPAPDGSLGVDRIGLINGGPEVYRAILSEANLLHAQMQASYARIPVVAPGPKPEAQPEFKVEEVSATPTEEASAEDGSGAGN